jgi:hypothetical protein
MWRERAAMLRYAYIAYRVKSIFLVISFATICI